MKIPEEKLRRILAYLIMIVSLLGIIVILCSNRVEQEIAGRTLQVLLGFAGLFAISTIVIFRELH